MNDNQFTGLIVRLESNHAGTPTGTESVDSKCVLRFGTINLNSKKQNNRACQNRYLNYRSFFGMRFSIILASLKECDIGFVKG